MSLAIKVENVSKKNCLRTINPRNPKKSAQKIDRKKPRWRQRQRNLPIAEKVELLGQTILETLEFEKVKKYAKCL